MKKQSNKKKKQLKKPKKNLYAENVISVKKQRIMIATIFGLFALLILRLFFLQVVDGEYLTSLAVNQQTKSEIISKNANFFINDTCIRKIENKQLYISQNLCYTVKRLTKRRYFI